MQPRALNKITVKTENLSHVYSENTPLAHSALENINMEVFEGDFFGIIGHTGSGKSTLIQHFNYLLKATEGKIFIAGEELTGDKKTLTNLRQKCGMVFQYPEYQLFGETAKEDVAFGLHNFIGVKSDKNKEGLTIEEIDQRVKEAIEKVGLDYEEIKDKSPFQMSGGQKRRLAIAGIIVTKPEILILDEPTAGLDPKGKGEILQLIRELHSSYTKTVIMISHDMDEIAENCNRVMVMHEGKVAIVEESKILFKTESLMEKYCLDIPLVSKVILTLAKKGLEVEFCGNNRELSKEIAKAIGIAKEQGKKLKKIEFSSLNFLNNKEEI